MMQVLELLPLAKRHVSGWSNVEEIKPAATVALVWMYQLVNQSLSQSEENSVKKFLKVHINLVEEFMVDLKTFLSVAMPHQYCLGVTN